MELQPGLPLPQGLRLLPEAPVWLGSLRHMKVPRAQLPQDFVSCTCDSDTGKRARGAALGS